MDIGVNIGIAIIVSFLTAIAIYFYRHFTYWSRHGVRGKKFIDLNDFTEVQHTYSLKLVNTYGSIHGAYKFFGKWLVVNEPDLIRDIMVKDFHVFTDRQHFHKGSTLFPLSLFFLRGDERWKRIRSIISPAFTSGKLRSMMAHMEDIADSLVANIEKVANKDEVIDLRRYIGAFAMDVITACAYGVNADSLNNPNHPIVVNAKKILNFDYGVSVMVSVLAPPIAKLLRLEPFDVNAIKYFEVLTNKIVDERKKVLKTIESSKRNKKSDFLQLMIDTEIQDEVDTMSDDESINKLGHNEKSANESSGSNGLSKNERTLTSEELTAQGILFFVAGYDTTSATLTHCFYHLANNADVQQKLYEELKTITDFNYETLNKLQYLNAVIQETLRICPALLYVDRECKRDYKLGNTGITIPAKTTVSFLPYALHHNPKYFEDPEQFKPERFINPTHNPYAYIPFGGGQRNCIGMRFALNEMRVCIARLISKFKVELKPNFELEYFAGSVLFSPKRLMVYIKSRD